MPPERREEVAEPIEASFHVLGDAPAGRPLVPLATMVEELRGLADQLADLARRNEALALEVGTLRERSSGHEGQLTAKDETIAELRRRAEVAEAERDALRAQAAPQPPPATPTIITGEDTPDAPAPAQGFWAGLGRWWRGGS